MISFRERLFTRVETSWGMLMDIAYFTNRLHRKNAIHLTHTLCTIPPYSNFSIKCREDVIINNRNTYNRNFVLIMTFALFIVSD